jgi:hypothetical protein
MEEALATQGSNPLGSKIRLLALNSEKLSTRQSATAVSERPPYRRDQKFRFKISFQSAFLVG